MSRDRAADDEIIRAIPQRLLRGRETLLIIRAGPTRTNTGGNDLDLLAKSIAQGPEFVRARDQSPNSRCHAQTC